MPLNLGVANRGPGTITLLFNKSTPPHSADIDGNGIPDECEGGARFHRGDPNNDGWIDQSDAVMLIEYLFLGGGSPSCLDAADANDDGALTITDPIVVLQSIFAGLGPLPDPAAGCGPDPTADSLGCGEYDNCP